MKADDVFMETFAIQEEIKTVLKEPEEKLFKRAMDELIIANEECFPNKTKALIYQGNVYKHSSLPRLPLIKPNNLEYCFVDRMNKELSHRKAVHQEIQQIWQALTPLCFMDYANIRDVLPDELVLCLDTLKKRQRTVEQRIYIEKLKAPELLFYQAMLPRMHYYLTLRMVT